VNYLIDTNVISEVRKGARCDANVSAWYAAIDDAQIYLSVLVLGEIRRGVERVRTSDATQARVLDQWLATVVESFGERVLTVDVAVADAWGRMSAKRSVSTVDALMAATALVHKMTLVTRNTADVIDLGASVLNPFDPAGRKR
jgi:toxin FitB